MKCFDFEGVSKIEQGLQASPKSSSQSAGVDHLWRYIHPSVHPSLAWKASDPASPIRYLKVRKTERSCLCRSGGVSEM